MLPLSPLRRRALGLALLCAFASLAAYAAPTAGASEPQRFEAHISLEHGDWVAVRVNVTGPSDFLLRGSWGGCRNNTEGFESTLGVGHLNIVDRKTVDASFVVAGARSTSFGYEGFSANGNGQKVEAPRVFSERSCDGSDVLDGTRGSGANESYTFVLISLAPVGWVDLRANWTYGVASWDIAHGRGLAKTADDFEQGVHASYYYFTPSFTVGAALREEVETTGSTLGWFWPANPYDLSPSVWSCSRNGEPCPQQSRYGMILLASSGPTSWEFAIDAEAHLRGPPYILALAELPDRSYID